MTNIIDIVDGKELQDSDLHSVINAIADGNPFAAGATDYKVTQSGTPGMSVIVTAGKLFNYVGSLNSYYISTLSTNTTLSVPSNSSGSTRIDIVCEKFDTSASSDLAGDNVGTLQYVQGTAGAGVPATPANYTKVAEISVASGASSIINSNITDRRNNLNLSIGSGQFVQMVNGTPSTPPAGTNKLYFKTDGKPHMLDSSGNETIVGSTNCRARAYLSSAQAGVVSTVNTKVLIDTVDYDTNSNWDVVTNHRYTVPITGYYLITGNVFSTDGQGVSGSRWSTQIWKNGARVSTTFGYHSGTQSVGFVDSDIIFCTANDYIELYTAHEAGANKTINSGKDLTFISIHLLSQ